MKNVEIKMLSTKLKGCDAMTNGVLYRVLEALYRVCFLRCFDFCLWCSDSTTLSVSVALAILTCFNSAGATSEYQQYLPIKSAVFCIFSLSFHAISVACNFCLKLFAST